MTVQCLQPALTDDLLEAFATRLKEELPLRRLSLALLPGGDIELLLMIVERERLGHGAGTEAMRRLERLADAYGRRLLVTPALPDDTHGTTSRARLVRFYRRFGFKENRGRNKDFATMAGMIREPQPSPEPPAAVEGPRP